MTTTKLTKAASNRKSLRTTVPKEVVTDLELKEGDSVEWEKAFPKSYRVTKTL
jgi:bifunctional DNA-binding transcriptional regulator/antitoxin component of YhaV-PrlF toxin-antitoxin module